MTSVINDLDHAPSSLFRYSGVAFDQNELGVQLGSMVLMEKGQPLAFDKVGTFGALGRRNGSIMLMPVLPMAPSFP